MIWNATPGMCMEAGETAKKRNVTALFISSKIFQFVFSIKIIS